MIVLSVLLTLTILAQAPPPAAFEVASVKPAGPNETGGWVRFLPGGRFEVVNAPLTFIIQQVYGLRDFQIVDAPKWISEWSTSRFTIEARAGSAANEDQLRLMAQTLLAERFQLKIHREVRPLPVYALLPRKNGVGLSAAKDNGRPPGGGGIERVALGVLQGSNVTMALLIRSIARELDRPLLDKTGFTQPFDFRLEWMPHGLEAAADDGRASLFSAVQEQLGLRLNAEKDNVDVIVIDHVEPPSTN